MSKPIILAAGGTGGHISPAEALAEELTARGEEVVFITDKRFADYNDDSYTGVLGSLPIYYVSAASLGGGPVRKLRNGLGIIVGIFQARRLLLQLRPKAVVGFGGYPSFPTVMAASQLKMNTVIHEQNSVLGRANRMLCERVRRIATSYQTTKRLPNSCHGKTTHTGNPVRAAFKALHQVPYAEPAENGTLRLLVFGGSQGATVFSETVPEAIKRLSEEQRARLRIDQQCRKADIEQVKTAYAEMGVSADLQPFFGDIPARMAAAHLVICRSGASSVAELSCAGRPAIMVPYPSATDDHQYYNAEAIEDHGGGWVMLQEGFGADALTKRLEDFLGTPARLTKAAARMHELGRPDSAKALADLVCDLADGKAWHLVEQARASGAELQGQHLKKKETAA